MVSYCSLSDSKSPRVSRTLLSILADLNNAVVRMLSTTPYIQILQSLYQSFGDCTKSLNYNRSNRHFHVLQFFQFPSKVQVLVLLFVFFTLWSAKFTILQVLFFFVDNYWVWSSSWHYPFVSESPRRVYTSHSPRQILGWAYTICLYGQISISCGILSGPPCPSSRVWSYAVSVLICCICLLWD